MIAGVILGAAGGTLAALAFDTFLRLVLPSSSAPLRSACKLSRRRALRLHRMPSVSLVSNEDKPRTGASRDGGKHTHDRGKFSRDHG